MRQILYILIINLFIPITLNAEENTVLAKSEHATNIDWDYSSEHGPENWGKLDPAYVLAAIGGSQSPVDIRQSEIIKADLPALNVEAHLQHSLHILNNGHTLETICPGAATLHFGRHEYELRQFHFP